jgi:hypothetical protein
MMGRDLCSRITRTMSHRYHNVTFAFATLMLLSKTAVENHNVINSLCRTEPSLECIRSSVVFFVPWSTVCALC